MKIENKTKRKLYFEFWLEHMEEPEASYIINSGEWKEEKTEFDYDFVRIEERD